MFTQLNQYRVVLEVPIRRFRAGRPRALERHLRARRQRRPARSRCRSSADGQHIAGDDGAPLAITHQGQFPAVTLSFNLRARRLARRGRARDRDDDAASWACRASIDGSFQGTAQAFRASLANEPLLILAALVTVYIVLGVLYESYIHPLTILSTLPSAGVGAILALMPVRHRAQRDRADRHHPAHRHREEERDHDDRLRARGRAPGGQAPGGGDLPGLPAALPADHDDDDGGAARRAAAGAGHGVGSELRRPLGIAIVGGLIVSQVLTLYTTPVDLSGLRSAGPRASGYEARA